MQRGGALNKIPMHQSPAPGIRALCESSLSGPACGRRLGLRMRPRPLVLCACVILRGKAGYYESPKLRKQVTGVIFTPVISGG